MISPEEPKEPTEQTLRMRAAAGAQMVSRGLQIRLADALQVSRDAFSAECAQRVTIEGKEVNVAKLYARLNCAGGDQR